MFLPLNINSASLVTHCSAVAFICQSGRKIRNFGQLAPITNGWCLPFLVRGGETATLGLPAPSEKKERVTLLESIQNRVILTSVCLQVVKSDSAADAGRSTERRPSNEHLYGHDKCLLVSTQIRPFVKWRRRRRRKKEGLASWLVSLAKKCSKKGEVVDLAFCCIFRIIALINNHGAFESPVNAGQAEKEAAAAAHLVLAAVVTSSKQLVLTTIITSKVDRSVSPA